LRRKSIFRVAVQDAQRPNYAEDFTDEVPFWHETPVATVSAHVRIVSEDEIIILLRDIVVLSTSVNLNSGFGSCNAMPVSSHDALKLILRDRAQPKRVSPARHDPLSLSLPQVGNRMAADLD
jgi:hypothetical protein